MRKNAIRFDFNLKQELVTLNGDGNSAGIIQSEIMGALNKCDKAEQILKKGLQKAEQGLKAAQDLGEPQAIEVFKRWVDTFGRDLNAVEKRKQQLKKVEIGI